MWGYWNLDRIGRIWWFGFARCRPEALPTRRTLQHRHLIKNSCWKFWCGIVTSHTIAHVSPFFRARKPLILMAHRVSPGDVTNVIIHESDLRHEAKSRVNRNTIGWRKKYCCWQPWYNRDLINWRHFYLLLLGSLFPHCNIGSISKRLSWHWAIWSDNT